MNFANKNYLDDGLMIVNNFLTLDDVRKFRKKLDYYFLNYKSYRQGEHGKLLCGFAGQTAELNELNILHRNKKLLSILENIVNICL